jgi:acetyltransferase-like isoleucine patch superfamily enzyme
MKILGVGTRIKNRMWSTYYRSQLEYVGRNVQFGGTHITIQGGKRKVGKGISLGDHCTIYDYCQLVSDDFDESCGITIGNNCHFNYNCYLCGTGGVIIGNHCLFGPGVKIIPTNHMIEDIYTNIIDQGRENGVVTIEDNVWVGAGAIILLNVRIKTGAVISAGAVVTRDVEENTVVGGVPATFIKIRGKSQENVESW